MNIRPIPMEDNEPRKLGPPVDPDNPAREAYCAPVGEKTCTVTRCDKCGVNIFLVFNIRTGNRQPVDIPSLLLTSGKAVPKSVFLFGHGTWQYQVAEVFTRAMQEREKGQRIFRHYHQPHQATCKPRAKPQWTPFNPVLRAPNVIAFPDSRRSTK